MRRTSLITFCGAAAAVALVGASPAAAAKVAGVKLLSCSPGDHSAVYQGRMTRVPGTDRMELRYTLLARPSGTKKRAEARLRVPGLDSWHRSKPGVGTFAWKQQLLNLAPGASYRVRVDYRWLDVDGAVIRSLQRRSAPCSQGDRLPNLRVRVDGASPTRTDGVWRYRIAVGNVGLAGARVSTVRLLVDGSLVDVELTPPLGIGVWNPLTVRGPACTMGVDVDVDHDKVIAESNETDNGAHMPCTDITGP
jgi:hypothetical protein